MKKEVTDCNFDYTTKENRENTITSLFIYAANERANIENAWKLFYSYYRRIKEKIKTINNKIGKEGLEDYIHLTDPFIHIESQINTAVPEPRFKGRDNKQDSTKAKQRQYVVKSILYSNDIDGKNAQNERAMRIFGDSFFKVYYDQDKGFNEQITGDISIDLVACDDIFPDPNANCINDCEYIDYVYYMHKRKVERKWGDKLKKAGIDLSQIGGDSRGETQEVSNANAPSAIMPFDVQIIEHWYRDDNGDICCSMLINDKEFHHIDKYWINTSSQNKNFPFVQFYRLKDTSGFWNISELEAILPLCDAADKLLNAGIQNMELTGNDVIVAEEGAISENTELTNEPGAVWMTTQGKINSVKRLGGLRALNSLITDIQFIQGEIQRTLRNYDSNTGKETARVTTASGLAQIRADAAEQSGIKDFDRMQGWKRLFLLIDWTALEFYDEDRLIHIGTPKGGGEMTDGMEENLDEKQGDIYFKFNSEKIRQAQGEKIIGYENGKIMTQNDGYYYPKIDCEVSASDGIEKSKSFTIQVLQALMQTQITIDNYKIAIKLIEELDIPQKDELIDEWINIFEPKGMEGVDQETQAMVSKLPPQQQALLKQRPDLLEMARNELESGQRV